MKTFPSHRIARGFTLMESVIAIGVVAVLLTTFLAVFGPASQSIRRSLSAQDADRLKSALEREMGLLREGTDSDYETAFEKAFEWIRESGNPETAVLLYNYRADTKNVRADGSFESYTGDDGQAGRDFLLQPAVRRLGDADNEFRDDVKEVEGQIFYVRMTQLVFDEEGALIPGEHGTMSNMHNADETVGDVHDYPGAMIAFAADFYALKSNDINYIENLDLEDTDGNGQPDKLGKPLFSRNLGVRR